MPKGANYSPERAQSATALSRWQEIHAVDFSGNGPKFFKGTADENIWSQDQFFRACYKRENQYVLAINEGTHSSQHMGANSAPVPDQSVDNTFEGRADGRRTSRSSKKSKRRPSSANSRPATGLRHRMEASEAKHVDRAFSTIMSINTHLLSELRDTKDKFRTMNSTLDVLTEAAAQRRTSKAQRPRSAIGARSSRPQSAQPSGRSTYSAARTALESYRSRPKSALPGHRPPLICSRPHSATPSRRS